MKSIREESKKIAFLLSMAFLFFSCANDYNPNAINQKKYSGEDIMNGLFFFKNEITEGIPQLAQLKSKFKKSENFGEISLSIDEFSKFSINYIKIHYPNFLNDLQTKVYSRNLYAISDAMNQASRYIEQAGLSSDKYRSAFLLGKKINNDDNLKKQISELDLSTTEGMNQFKLIIENAEMTNVNGKNTCITTAFAAALAVFYVAVGAVSIAVGAYSVYFKVAYWGPGELIPQEEFPDKEKEGVAVPFGDEVVTIEHEVLIAETGDFFRN